MDPFLDLGLSLGLGLLIGLQRERTATQLGGIRTFPLISLFGTMCGLLGTRYGVWMPAAGLLAVLGILALSNFLAVQKGAAGPGQTSEIAALLTFTLGAYLPEGNTSVVLVASGVVVMLLHLREPMHHMVERIGRRDMAGIMRLVVISLIILPILPDRAFGPFQVLNPFDIWLMVVLIVTISLGGYIAYKILGEKSGTILSGILGGVISSTATTVSFARRLRSAPHAWHLGLVAILIASAIAYIRVLVEIALIAPAYLGRIAPPILAMLLWMALIAAGVYFLYRGEGEKPPAPTNPAELKSALIFGAIYAVVLFAVAAVKQLAGAGALYTAAVISGLVNMDAITLSISRLVEATRIEPNQGWRLILVASLANLVFKGAAVAFLGNWRLAARLGLFFGLAIAGGLAIVWFWPAAWSWQLRSFPQ